MASPLTFTDEEMAFLEQVDAGNMPTTLTDQQMSLLESYDNITPEKSLINNAADLIPDEGSTSNIFNRIGLFGKELAMRAYPTLGVANAALETSKLIMDEGIGKVAKEAGIGLTKGGMGIPETASQNMNYVGRLLRVSDEKLKPLVDMGIINPAKAKTAKLLSDNLIKYGEKWTKHWQGEKAFMNKFRDQETWEGTFEGNFSVARTIASITESIPMFAVGAIGGARTGSAFFGASILGNAEGLDVFQEALDKGKSDARALTVGAITGVASTASELVFGAMTDIISPKATSVLNSMWKEALQESGQQVITNTIRKIGVDKTVGLFDGLVESFVVGGLTGGAMTGLANSVKKKAVLDAQKDLTPEEFQQVASVVETVMKDNAEGINKAFETHLDDFVAAKDKQVEEKQAAAEQPQEDKLTDIWNKAQKIKNARATKIEPEVKTPEQLKKEAYLKKYRASLSTPFMIEQLGELTEKQKDAFVFQKEKEFEQVNNYRKFLDYPAISEMTDVQVDEYVKMLSQFNDKDVFLSQKTIEAAQKIDGMKDIFTYRQAQEKLSGILNIPVENLIDMAKEVSGLDKFTYDTKLAQKNPLFNYIVKRTHKHLIDAEAEFYAVEKKVNELATATNKLRNLSLTDRLIPQNEKLMNYLEASDVAIDELGNPVMTKDMIAQTMTKEELSYADYMKKFYSDAYDYLIKIEALQGSRFEDAYFTHIRRGFLETVKEEGIKKAIEGIYKQQADDKKVFTILDQKTGKILPKEKFFANTLFRSGELEPSKNVTQAFKSYAKTFLRKKAFDQMIPELDIYVQALTPRDLTKQGLEKDQRLKDLVYTYINNKKGRRISFSGVIEQGGTIDISLRMTNLFVSLLDLGFYIPSQIASFVGEQVMTQQTVGTPEYFKALKQRIWDLGIERKKHPNADKIINQTPEFTGRNVWDELSEPDKPFGELLLKTIFGAFSQSSVEANKIFLLASLSEQELNSGIISSERLAELRLDAGRWRDMGSDMKSIVGSTSIGQSFTKYKGWAIPILTTTAQDLQTVQKDIIKSISKKTMPNFNMREYKELARATTTAGLIFMIGSLLVDKDDDSMIGKLKARVYQEALTFLAGVDLTTFASQPRIMSFTGTLVKHIMSIVKLEKYKEKKRKGQLKGVEGLKRTLTPKAIKQFLPEN